MWSAEQSSTPVLQLLSAPASAGASFDDLTDLVRHSTARIVGNPLVSQQWIHTKEDQIVSVRRITTGITDVYNLKVQGSPEYFANGVLVHNCDALVDGVWMLLGKPLSIFDVLGSTKKKA